LAVAIRVAPVAVAWLALGAFVVIVALLFPVPVPVWAVAVFLAEEQLVDA
jgi:hypothetical protein